MKPLVIQTENIPPQCSDWLGSKVDLHICPQESLRFHELISKAEALVIRTYTTIDAALLDSAQSLKVVGRAGVGVDNIDLKSCKEHSIKVVHTPNANTEAVVEFVLSTMLCHLRQTHAIDTALDIKEWRLHREGSVLSKQWNELTLGIIGFGRVGSGLGAMARRLGFRVLFNDLKQIQSTSGCEQVEIETLLQNSDIVSVHVDGRVENTHLLNHAVFSKLKTSAIFINTSRGFVVNTAELSVHLHANPETVAIIDVHDPEPFPLTYPLLNNSNAYLYPHIAAKTETATLNMGWVVRDVVSVLNGKPPKHQVLYGF